MAPLGSLIRLSLLSSEGLPYHALLHGHPNIADDLNRPTTDEDDAESSGHPTLEAFLKEVLDEATQFMDDLPSTFREGSLKSSPPPIADVRRLSRAIPRAQLAEIPRKHTSAIRPGFPDEALKGGETWFARRSRHSNQKQNGTADFHEFNYGIRIDHSEHERDYSPNVCDAVKIVEWDLPDESNKSLGNYSEPQMTKGWAFPKGNHYVVYEMCHKLPAPLSPRIFPELVVTAMTGSSSFIVVQVPVNIQSMERPIYRGNRNPNEGIKGLERKKSIMGAYASIELCRLVTDQGVEMVEWTMATTSDAKGWLPMWAQKLGVPGAISKDVTYFMNWIAGRRRMQDPEYTRWCGG